MAASLDDLTTKFDDMAKQLSTFSDVVKQFTGLREMMTQTLDVVNGMGRRQTSAETMLADLRDQAASTTTTIRDTATRIDNLARRVESLETPRSHLGTGCVDNTMAPQPRSPLDPHQDPVY